METLVGPIGVAVDERDPREMLVDPRLAAAITQVLEHGARHDELLLRGNELEAEYLCHAEQASGLGLALLVADGLPLLDGAGEGGGRRGQVPVALFDLAFEGAHTRDSDRVFTLLCDHEGLGGVGAGGIEIAARHRRPRPHHEKLGATGIGVAPGELQRAVGELTGDAAVVEGASPPSRSGQRRCGPFDQVVGHALHRTEIGHELSRGGEMVGHGLDEFGILLDALGDRRRHTDVALRARRLRERAVRDVAHGVGSETPPTLVVDHEETLGRERRERLHGGSLAELVGEALQRAERTTRAEHRGVVDHLAFVGREAVEASLHETAQRARQGGYALAAVVAGQERGQLLEEERIAAAAVDELVHDVVGQLLADEVVEQRRGRIAPEGIETQDHVVVFTDRRPARGLLLPRGGEEDERARREVLHRARAGRARAGRPSEGRTRRAEPSGIACGRRDRRAPSG